MPSSFGSRATLDVGGQSYVVYRLDAVRGLRGATVDRLPFKAPAFPVLANATGEAMRTVTALQEELRQQMLRQVDWARTMVSMKTMEVKTVVELGPGRVLASLAAKHIPGVDTWNADELFVEFADTATA